MKIETSEFLVNPGEKVKLKHRPTKVKPVYSSKEEYKELLEGHVKRLDELHQLLYGSDEYAVLLVLQGMDASGKDGAIRHVMSGVNPQGCEVTSFKQPSVEELQHDFLWRSMNRLPGRGRIGIFNRSYYEEVLVLRVHPELLVGEGVQGRQGKSHKIWQERYRAINEMERHLHHCKTRVVKVYLHLSKDEQKNRFLARIDEPDKNWKFSTSDIQERKYWKDYMAAYEECLESTSTKYAPWYTVPADDKENARLIVSQILVNTMEELKMSYPKTTPKREAELKNIREMLEK